MNTRSRLRTLESEDGSALLIAMLILVVITLVGIFSIRTSSIEVEISGNHRLYKEVFNAADGGAEAGIELVEQNIYSAGFDDAGGGNFLVGNFAGPSLNFYLSGPPNMPSDINRDAFTPSGYAGSDPHTNLTIGGNPSLSTGSAIQMAAGYEGIGKGTAGAGAVYVYDIWSQRIGARNSSAVITLQWEHIM